MEASEILDFALNPTYNGLEVNMKNGKIHSGNFNVHGDIPEGNMWSFKLRQTKEDILINGNDISSIRFVPKPESK